MKKIFAIIDYKGHFGSKWEAKPYRSGFDKSLLTEACNKLELDVEFLKPSEIRLNHDWKNRNVIYTSSEEHGFHYKNYLEDVVLALHHAGANLLPGYPFFRANNNKVFMELLRDHLLGEQLSGLKSVVFGTMEELQYALKQGKVKFPAVIKEAAGAMSRGVYLAKTDEELILYAKKISQTASLKVRLKEKIRVKKHEGYHPESFYQKKFIVQPFIPDLKNDWKILIFGDHYYILKRGIQKGDFRASGSGKNYKAGLDAEFPESQFEHIKQIYEKLNVPMLSLDYAFDGKKGYLLEFQAVYFGTATHTFCDHFFVKRNNGWKHEENKYTQEEEYAYGIVHYLEKRENSNQ